MPQLGSATAIMSDLQVFPEQEEKEEQSFYCLEKPQKVALILARASASLLNSVMKRDNIQSQNSFVFVP